MTRRTAQGVAWSAAQKWVLRLTGFATVALLARLLGPGSFGLVAAASAVVPLLYLLADLGFSTYIVQADRLERPTLDTAFWFAITSGLLLAGTLALTAPLLADAIHVDGLGPVLAVLAVCVVLVAAGSVPTALLRRRMAFGALAVQGGAAALVGQVAAVVTALAGWGVWALVVQMVLNQGVASALAWRAARWWPGRGFAWHELRAMARFGGSVVGVELLALMRSWAETAIITLALGVTGLGYLTIAQRLVDAVKDVTVSAVMPVATSAFARIRGSAARLRRGYLDVAEVTYAIAVPFLVVLVVAGPDLVPLVFGPSWGPSVHATQALAVAGLLVTGAMVDHALLYGVGRPMTWLTYAAGIEVLTVAATAVGVGFGVGGVAIGFVVVAVIATALRTLLVARVIEARATEAWAPTLRAAALALWCAGAALVAVSLVPSGATAARLTVVGAAVSVAYLVGLETLLPRTRRLVHRVAGPLALRARRAAALSLGREHVHV